MLYPQAQSLYIQAGWTTDFNILPVKGKSQDLPVGFTGYSTAVATPEQYQRWARQKPEYNITLALLADSEFVLFDVDTDAEKGKQGYVQWFEFWDSLGIDCNEVDAQCWISSARENPTARGQRLVRVPKGMEWPSKLDADIEIIRYGHRHAVVYPSIHPDTHTEYRWYQPGDTKTPSERIPTPEDIVFSLPDEAVTRITRGEMRKSRPVRKDMAWTDVSDWLVSRAEAEGAPCDEMAKQLDRAKDYILNRHNYGLDVHHAALKGTDSLIHLAHEGHSGAVTALQDLYEVFTSVATTRDSDENLHVGEWKRAIEGSVAKMQGDPDKSCWCGMTLKKSPGATSEVPTAQAEALEDKYARAVETRKLELSVDRDARAMLAREATEGFEDQSVTDALEDILAGEDDLSPTVGELVDAARRLFYEGQINGIYGDGGTGKTWLVASEQAKALNEGGYVIHWEFDNNPTKRIVRRLVLLGADVNAIRARFRVLRSTADMQREITPEIIKGTTLVTLDALTPAIGSLGGDVNSPTGTDSVFAAYLSPFTIHGACGIYIDHVGHENKDRQSGSIRKFQATQGALYEIQSRKVPEVGQTGLAELVLRKDNQGGAGSMNKRAAYVSYESKPNRELTVHLCNTMPGLMDQIGIDFKEASKTAEAKQERHEKIVIWALETMDKSANAPQIHQYLADTGNPQLSLTEKVIRTTIGRLEHRGRMAEDKNIAGIAPKGGRPSTYYRLSTPSHQ